jgi:hypothetical protein
VTEGKELPTDSGGIKSANKQKIVASNNDFRYLQSRTVFVEKESSPFFKSSLFYALLLFPLLLITLGVLLGKKQKARARDLIGNRTRKADKLARKYLSIAKRELGEKEAFYVALEKALHNYLKAKLQIETAEISKDRITELLEIKGVSSVTVAAFIAVLDDCDFARYAPVSNVTTQQEYDKAKEIIAKLDKQF